MAEGGCFGVLNGSPIWEKRGEVFLVETNSYILFRFKDTGGSRDTQDTYCSGKKTPGEPVPVQSVCQSVSSRPPALTTPPFQRTACERHSGRSKQVRFCTTERRAHPLGAIEGAIRVSRCQIARDRAPELRLALLAPLALIIGLGGG